MRPGCTHSPNGARAHTELTRLGFVQSFSPYTHLRYATHFGQKNYVVQLANHTLTFIDAPGYVDEESKRLGKSQTFETWKPLSGGTLDFMTKFKKGTYFAACFFVNVLRSPQKTTLPQSSSSLTFLCTDQMAAAVALCANGALSALDLELVTRTHWASSRARSYWNSWSLP